MKRDKELAIRAYEVMFSRIHGLAERAGLDGEKTVEATHRAITRYQRMHIKKGEVARLEKMWEKEGNSHA